MQGCGGNALKVANHIRTPLPLSSAFQTVKSKIDLSKNNSALSKELPLRVWMCCRNCKADTHMCDGFFVHMAAEYYMHNMINLWVRDLFTLVTMNTCAYEIWLWLCFFLQVTFDINMYTDGKQSKETKNVVSKNVSAPHLASSVGYRHPYSQLSTPYSWYSLMVQILKLATIKVTLEMRMLLHKNIVKRCLVLTTNIILTG